MDIFGTGGSEATALAGSKESSSDGMKKRGNKSFIKLNHEVRIMNYEFWGGERKNRRGGREREW